MPYGQQKFMPTKESKAEADRFTEIVIKMPLKKEGASKTRASPSRLPGFNCILFYSAWKEWTVR
jgi:hypothetical protein